MSTRKMVVREEVAREITTDATYNGKPISIEFFTGNAFSNHEGAKAILVERIPQEVISHVTGRSLGKKERIIGAGILKNGKVDIFSQNGDKITITVNTVPASKSKQSKKEKALKLKRYPNHGTVRAFTGHGVQLKGRGTNRIVLKIME